MGVCSSDITFIDPAGPFFFRLSLARQVAELIAGLADLGCTRTMGEDQTVCVMSDSFDIFGNAAALQASGDLPQVEVVKVRTAIIIVIDFYFSCTFS